MSALQVLAELQNAGIRLEPRPNGNLYVAPKNRLTPELIESIRSHKVELLAVLRSQHEQAERDANPLSDPGHPALGIVATCRRYGVALRIDADGTLVVGKAGAKAEEPTQPWSSLVREIEVHLDAVACLVAAGWHLRAEFPNETLQ